ncbi:hypothetical protein CHLRE_02g104000v5 [Chlamydomonas reinhardtii]|uniref:Uncharacterized protein n=1 Tax=Chlamydomonas reinhardtii TaxID=3055 RepID=A8I4E6_CHLRE|nr:uncharacterized protein CHLRE_02g104000v5 [Chlamydomonas reinhardtii]PNW86982.1 hypothetical protein CHLRE_02g104000v5 [Chlamydomonas reinhardtii]|eukprot:XP_001699989.1 predicted protein [Chlamydomonas reinhardtii]
MPLVGLEPAAELLPGPLAQPLLLHTFVALANRQLPEQGCLILDFLPEKPTDPATAVSLATGLGTAGVLRVRRRKGPLQGRALRTRLETRFQEARSDAAVLDVVEQLNSTWDTRLQLLTNDCRHYSAALLTALTGRSYTLEDVQIR